MNYFPGEALLALAMSAEQGDSESLEACFCAFEPYRKYFRAAPSTAFVGWHVDVWSRLARLMANENYADFAFEQLDWLLPLQLGSRSSESYCGGFAIDGKRPNVSSTVYTEAIIRGAALAKHIGDESRWRLYASAARAGLKFCSQLQIEGAQVAFLPHPDRALGGVTGSLSNFEVRSDHVQHTITMAIAALDTPGLLLA